MHAYSEFKVATKRLQCSWSPQSSYSSPSIFRLRGLYPGLPGRVTNLGFRSCRLGSELLRTEAEQNPLRVSGMQTFLPSSAWTWTRQMASFLIMHSYDIIFRQKFNSNYLLSFPLLMSASSISNSQLQLHHQMGLPYKVAFHDSHRWQLSAAVRIGPEACHAQRSHGWSSISGNIPVPTRTSWTVRSFIPLILHHFSWNFEVISMYIVCKLDFRHL